MTAARGESLAVTVIGGYLGAGKTTLVNHILRNAGGRRLAVLVNDFGDLPIDADLIESTDDDVISIAGGCICCSFGSDLLAALMRLAERRPAPDHVVIEASGVALPGSVAAALTLLTRFVLDGVVVIADAETVRARAADRYLADTILRQLADADLVILNKIDLAPAAQRPMLHAWLAEHAPRATVVDAVQAALPTEIALGLDAQAARPGATTHAVARAFAPTPGGTIAPLPPPAAPTERYRSASYEIAQALDLRALADALVQPQLGVIRAKGLLRDADGAIKNLQIVGRRWTVTALEPRAGLECKLVCIGLETNFDTAAIDHVIHTIGSIHGIAANDLPSPRADRGKRVE